MPCKTIEQCKQAGQRLISKGLKKLIIRHDNGTIFKTNEFEKCIKPYIVDVVDPTGAGNCFVGVFATYLAKGKDEITCIKYANVASSLCKTKEGAAHSFPHENEIEEAFAAMSWD